MSAVVEHVSADTMVVVRHEAVPGLMDQMASMALFSESRALLENADLHPGDRVLLTVSQLPDKLLIVEIRKIP